MQTEMTQDQSPSQKIIYNKLFTTRAVLIAALLVIGGLAGGVVWRGHLGGLWGGLWSDLWSDLITTGHAATSGTITGVVFQDYNGNGSRETNKNISNAGGGSVGVAVDKGVPGVAVTVFGQNGAIAGSAATDDQGNYSVSATGAGPYRVEFTNIPAGYKSGPVGPDSKSTVQFVADGDSTNISLGLVVPAEFCQDNPLLATACYVGGAQNTADPVIVNFPYSAGTDRKTGGMPFDDFDSPAHGIEARANQVGTAWGIVYARSTKQLFVSAFTKKHSGFGTGGTGAIYKIDRTNPGAVSLYADLNAIFGANTAGADPHNTSDYDRDNGNTAWDAVGKVSLGQLSISDDEKKLYVMNLADRSLYELPLDNTPSTSTIRRRAVPLNPPGCPSANDVRPYAVRYRNNKLYVGMVCSAESTISQSAPDGDASKLQAYIYTVDPASLDFSSSPIFQTPLNYTRRCTDSAQLGPPNCFSAVWRVWSPVYRNIANQGRAIYPQPLLTDIEFDRGNLVIALRDRAGDQLGTEVLSNPADSLRYYGVTAGDILRACGSESTGWTLENNGRCGGAGTAPQNTGEGPGNGEFYFEDDAKPFIDENSIGGMIQIPGFPNIVVNVYDPIPIIDPDTLFDGGARWMNNSTGSSVKNHRIYNGTRTPLILFGKANGLGDIAALCDAAPIEIGNRIWQDTNGNGIQDADEIPIGSINVALFKNGVQVGAATTNGRGEFYFNSSNVPGGLLPNTVYEIRVDKSQTALSGFTLTKTKADSSPNGESRDSDATMSGSNAVIALTTAGPGENNHTYDIGFVPPGGPLTISCPPDITVTITTSSSTVVNYPDPVVTGEGATVTCTPPSGSVFQAGTTRVNCKASNAAGIVTCGFNVIVKAPPPPTISCPIDIVVTAPHPAGTVVNYPLPTASDGATVTCTPPSGSAFVPGRTRVTCTATNAVGSASCGFDIIVNAPPDITCSTDVFEVSTTEKVVFYVPPIVFGIGATVSCAPPSGAVFPLGTTKVVCTAMNATGSATCDFKVTVAPKPPPTISCPIDISTVSTSVNGAVVNYTTPSSNNDATVSCTPPSGSTFPVGTSRVNCTAMNIAGSASCGFNVNVRDLVKPTECAGICFRSPVYYLNKLDKLPKGTVVISGYNFNSPVSTKDTNAIGLALRGSAIGGGMLTPEQQFNQEWVAAQISILASGTSNATLMWSTLNCYGAKFDPVTLSNGVILAPDTMFKILLMQINAVINENRVADMEKLAFVLDKLNGNDPTGRCNR